MADRNDRNDIGECLIGGGEEMNEWRKHILIFIQLLSGNVGVAVHAVVGGKDSQDILELDVSEAHGWEERESRCGL